MAFQGPKWVAIVGSQVTHCETEDEAHRVVAQLVKEGAPITGFVARVAQVCRGVARIDVTLDWLVVEP